LEYRIDRTTINVPVSHSSIFMILNCNYKKPVSTNTHYVPFTDV